ncbi:MAG: hypothetical protein DCC51_09565 [Anaerolineae bacterium]|nr:MAG: hypothetical protein DCC51_09565 [Anaerolineae bacterium]
MIAINGLVKQYGLNPVLRGVNLNVAEGEFVTLVGPNGAGKSTLMGIVATLLRPSRRQAKSVSAAGNCRSKLTAFAAISASSRTTHCFTAT